MKKSNTLFYPEEDKFVVELKGGDNFQEPVDVKYEVYPGKTKFKMSYLGKELPTTIENTRNKVVFKVEECNQDCFVDMYFQFDNKKDNKKEKVKLTPPIKIKRG